MQVSSFVAAVRPSGPSRRPSLSASISEAARLTTSGLAASVQQEDPDRHAIERLHHRRPIAELPGQLRVKPERASKVRHQLPEQGCLPVAKGPDPARPQDADKGHPLMFAEEDRSQLVFDVQLSK